jgi:hypothetical protein
VKLNAFGVAAVVVTLHVPEVVFPTVTVAVTAVLVLADDVNCSAMVSPEPNPAKVVPPHDPPFREMAVHPVHVAVNEPVKPVRVTALLLMVVLVLTPVWLVKLNPAGVLPPIISQLVPLQA